MIPDKTMPVPTPGLGKDGEVEVTATGGQSDSGTLAGIDRDTAIMAGLALVGLYLLLGGDS